MTDPVLHLLAGSNGAGKSTLFALRIGPLTRLPFVNADVIAAERWPDDTAAHGHEASALAAAQRDELLAARASFATETVFSHPSKVDLVRTARTAGYLVTLHVVLVPVELTVARVANRVETGGHDVPEDKVRAQHARLWAHVAEAIGLAHDTIVYDNSRPERAFRIVARFRDGRPVGAADWPGWVPDELVALTGG